MPESDCSSIGSVIAAGYECLSGPAGPRDWDRFRTLYVEGARVNIIDDAETGSPVLCQYDVDGYIARVAPLLMEQDFYEIEIARRYERYGRIAHAFSTYASLRDPEGEPFMLGINSFQLQLTDVGWKVVSILWDRQPAEALPERYRQSVTV
jgi:hypothetical protein